MTEPDAVERPLVALLWSARELLAKGFGNDYALRDGLAHLLLGAEVLLNAEWGRLDRGSVSRLLEQTAAGMKYDLGSQQFEDEKE